jgi:hypothetical protein
MGNALEKQHKSKIARYYAKMIKKLNQLIFQRINNYSCKNIIGYAFKFIQNFKNSNFNNSFFIINGKILEF